MRLVTSRTTAEVPCNPGSSYVPGEKPNGGTTFPTVNSASCGVDPNAPRTESIKWLSPSWRILRSWPGQAHEEPSKWVFKNLPWVKGAAVRTAAVPVMSPPSCPAALTAFSARIQRRHPVTHGSLATTRKQMSLNSYGKPRRWGPYWCGQDRYWNYFDMFLAGTEGGDKTFVKFWNVGSAGFKFVLQLVHVQYNGWIVFLSNLLCWIFEI